MLLFPFSRCVKMVCLKLESTHYQQSANCNDENVCSHMCLFIRSPAGTTAENIFFIW